MKFSRDQIKGFMDEYFRDYSTIAQDPEKNHQMSKYYASDMKFTVYLGEVAETDPQDFLLRTASHQSIQENLTPAHYIIDENSGMIAVLVKGVMTKKATGKVIREMWFSAHYELKTDENGNLKMIHLWLFFQYAPDGEKNLVEIYMEDMMNAQKGEY